MYGHTFLLRIILRQPPLQNLLDIAPGGKGTRPFHSCEEHTLYTLVREGSFDVLCEVVQHLDREGIQGLGTIEGELEEVV